MEGYYKVAQLDKFGGKIHIKEKSFRELKRFEILIRVVCSTVHPADLMFINGVYGDMQPDIFPVIPGFEGSGEIIKVGDDIDRKYVGKRVAVLSDPSHHGIYEGMWAEYHYTTLPNVLVFDANIPYEKICFIINPLTALGMFDTIKKKKNRAVVQTGAASSVGKMFIRLCQREGIETINIVKDDDEVNALKKMNAPNIIKTEKDWEKQLEFTCIQLKALSCFDCLGGDMTGKLLNCLPIGGILYNFGNLQEKDLATIHPSELIFKDKTIMGWWLVRWMQSLSQKDLEYYWGFIKVELQSDSKLFETDISKAFNLDDINKGIDFYTSNMKEGKVLIKPFYT
jgi:NADPH2:quinone reductase